MLVGSTARHESRLRYISMCKGLKRSLNYLYYSMCEKAIEFLPPHTRRDSSTCFDWMKMDENYKFYSPIPFSERQRGNKNRKMPSTPLASRPPPPLATEAPSVVSYFVKKLGGKRTGQISPPRSLGPPVPPTSRWHVAFRSTHWFATGKTLLREQMS